MPESAREAIDLYLGLYSERENFLTRVGHLGTELEAKAMAMQQAGAIPLHTDPEWIKATLDVLPIESLR